MPPFFLLLMLFHNTISDKDKNMKIQLIEPGYESFNGHFGVIEFADGVSVNEVSPLEAERLGSLVRVQTLDGKDPSAAQKILDTYSNPMELATTPVGEPEAVVASVSYTAEQLAVVADEGGIKAIRAIAEPLGMKGTSIAELIGKILAASAAPAPAAAEAPVEAPVETPAEPVQE